MVAKDRKTTAPEDDTPPDGADAPVEEAVPETDVAEVAEEAAEDDEVARLKAEVDDLGDRLLRAMAETENVRRRAAKDREDAGKYAITGFARDLLPVIDNLGRALASVTDEARADDGVKALVEGVEMTERELLSVLERHGVKRVEALGERFDHNLHQAMFEVETGDKPPGTVVEVMQPGYVIADRLLRPAMVGVAKAPKPSVVETGDDGDED